MLTANVDHSIQFQLSHSQTQTIKEQQKKKNTERKNIENYQHECELRANKDASINHGCEETDFIGTLVRTTFQQGSNTLCVCGTVNWILHKKV